MKKIKLNNGRVALVDDEDFDALTNIKWVVTPKGGTAYARGYVRVRGVGVIAVLMHRYILDPPGKYVVDHINGDGLDNRRENLRACTHTENLQNMRKLGGSSSYRGVHWDSRRERWVASIRVSGKKTSIGAFEDEVQAAKAYDEVCRKTRGQFARCNFGPPGQLLLKGQDLKDRGGLDFGDVLRLLKTRQIKAARRTSFEKGVYIQVRWEWSTRGNKYTAAPLQKVRVEEGRAVKCARPPTTEDVFADDWEVVPEEDLF